jgi:hypothetical protein
VALLLFKTFAYTNCVIIDDRTRNYCNYQVTLVTLL